MAYKTVLIPGDGIGPEVTAAARSVVEATGVKIEWETHLAGQAALDAVGAPLPAETLNAVQDARATLKGPTATPSGTGFRSVNVELRQKLKLFANYRPARTMPGVPTCPNTSRRTLLLRRIRSGRMGMASVTAVATAFCNDPSAKLRRLHSTGGAFSVTPPSCGPIRT